MHYVDEEIFDNIDFFNDGFTRGDYEYCVFNNCNFANCDLSQTKFIECEFNECNLSSVEIINTSFQNSNFNRCKMLGLQFDVCNPFGLILSFNKCTLNHSTFHGLKLNGTNFNESTLHEVFFSNCQLKSSSFKGCDLLYTTFENNNLEKASFSNAKNYSFDPDKNVVKGAQFDVPEVIGLLNKYKLNINS